jgi:hypothetical protein
VLRSQRLELADDFALMPKRELRLDSQFDCGQAKLLETPALVPAEGFSELGEGGPRQSASAPASSSLAFSELFCESACRAPATECSKRERSSSSSPTSSR